MSGLPEVGTRYGRYLINRLTGAGALGGVVYEATDTMLRRSVALTVVPHGVGPASERQDRFRRESDLLARVRSPNVVTVLDHGTIDGSAYRATDRVADGDLATWIATHGPMPRAEALALTSQVCGALADAHAARVVHPALVPEAILLRDGPGGPAPLLSDFADAREGQDPDRVDQRAVGTLLWTCLTGVAPAASGIPRVGGDSADDKAINGLLQRVLSPDPEDRYVSVGELRAALDRIALRTTSTTPIVTMPVAPVIAGETVRTEPTLFRSPEAAEAADAAQAAQAAGAAEAAEIESPPASPPPAVAGAAPTVAPPVSAPAPAPRRRAVPASGPASRRPWWLAAVAAAVLLLGGGVFALTRSGGDDTAPRAASASPPAAASASPSPSLTPTPTPTPAPSATAPPAPAPAKPKPAIGRLTRSDAACEGTTGDYQKWAYALTGFKPGRTLTPHLAIRSDRGNGETSGKAVTIGPKGTARGDFCVPAGTHGTVTITVADTVARRPIG